jgi:hypothetical protein
MGIVTLLQTADEFAIPREKYGIITDVMDKSKASILVKFDGNNRFLSADPDVYNEIPFDSELIIKTDRRIQ